MITKEEEKKIAAELVNITRCPKCNGEKFYGEPRHLTEYKISGGELVMEADEPIKEDHKVWCFGCGKCLYKSYFNSKEEIDY